MSLIPFFKNKLVLVAAGAVGGTVLGTSVFVISLLDGLDFFVVVGGLLGLLATGAYLLFADNVELTEVQVGVPIYTQATFSVGQKDRDVAWSLFVETTSRIATQRLEQGILREALSSLHSLFMTTRSLLKTKPPSLLSPNKTVEELGLAMLNTELRPFLSKWHPLLTEFEADAASAAESDWEHNSIFRAELEELRRRLVPYAKAFGDLSGLSDADHLITSPTVRD
jgi:hypothetical protein